MTSSASEAAPDRPVLRIVRGDATPEELAALTAIVAVAGGGADEAETPVVRGRWNDPAHSMRRFWPHGTGGWRAAR